jgi:hypothetical protein
MRKTSVKELKNTGLNKQQVEPGGCHFAMTSSYLNTKMHGAEPGFFVPSMIISTGVTTPYQHKKE